jgi:hypothetical protein
MENELIKRGCLDDRNIDLWRQLNEVHFINVKFQNINAFSVYSIRKESTIFVPNNFISAGGFTHELLHIYLRTKDVYMGNGMLRMVREDPQMQKILTEKLLEQVHNCMGHIKMFPIFKRMGYPDNDFLHDYYLNKLGDNKIIDIKNNMIVKPCFRKSYFNKSCVDFYIGTFFAAKACPYTVSVEERNFKELRQINPELYDILDTFIEQWIPFDIENIDPIYNEYNTMETQLTIDLKNWIMSNRI